MPNPRERASLIKEKGLRQTADDPKTRPRAVGEENAYLKGKDLELETKRLKNEQLRQNIKERKRYAGAIFVVICLWLVVVTAIVALSGISRDEEEKRLLNLSDNVLIALVGTTTANVLGVLVIVVKYIFKDDD